MSTDTVPTGNPGETAADDATAILRPEPTRGVRAP